MQAITYREFLPVLLGPDRLPPYRGYDVDVDPRIANLFSTACYRFGHSMLGPALRDGDAFWNQRALPLHEEREVEATRLSDVIRRNTAIGAELPDDVFRVQ